MFCLDYDRVDCHEPEFPLVSKGDRVIVLGRGGKVLADMATWEGADKVARAVAEAYLDGWRACQRELCEAIAEGRR